MTSKYFGSNNIWRTAFRLISPILSQYNAQSIQNVLYIVNYRKNNPQAAQFDMSKRSQARSREIDDEISL